MEEYINKLVVECKNPKKKAKLLCKQLRKILLPNVTYKLSDKSASIQNYKSVAEELKMSHFIVTGETYIKIGKRPDGPTFTFKIDTFCSKITPLHFDFYKSDPLVTISGKSDFSSVFTGLTHPSAIPVRNIHFDIEGDRVEMRHYKIETKEEDDIKVGLTEIGPRLTMRKVKVEEGFFNTK